MTSQSPVDQQDQNHQLDQQGLDLPRMTKCHFITLWHPSHLLYLLLYHVCQVHQYHQDLPTVTQVGGAANHMITLTLGPGAEANPSSPGGPDTPYDDIT